MSKCIKNENGIYVELPRDKIKFESKETELIFDLSLENDELYQQNQKLNNILNKMGVNPNEILYLEQENQELKKQLEERPKEYVFIGNAQNKTRDFINQITKDNKEYKNQQKEFIEYLEAEISGCEAVSDLLFSHNKEIKVYKEVLQKYKEIIGVPMAGLDDEEEPDLFEMIEDMKNKPKHIEEINKSYPIFNFDEKSFEAMKDMLQDVYSKQVEIIKLVNYLLDKEQNNESPAELN